MAQSSREGRESQALQLRRAILKASGSQLAMELHRAEGQVQPMQSPESKRRSGSVGDIALYKLLDASDAAYQDRLNALKRFNSKSKASTKQNSLKSEWIKEHEQLRGAAHSTERDVGSLLEMLVMHAPADALVRSLVDASFDHARERKDNERELISQLSDLKRLFKDTAKSLSAAAAGAATNTSAETTTGAVGSDRGQPSPVAAIFADVLMQIRASQTEKLDSMALEESQLTAEIAGAHRVVVKMLQRDRLDQQNVEFSSQLRPEDGDDDEVALVLEEWYAKLEVLDRAHAAEIDQIKQERETLMGQGGWPEKDHLTFAKIFSHFQKTGSSRKALVTQLAVQLAHIPQAEVERHEAWHRACLALGQKRKILSSSHEAARQNLIDQAKTQVDAFRLQRRESLFAAQRQAAHEASRKMLHQVLDGLRAAREESDAQRRSQKEREDASLIEESQRAAAALRAEQDWKKQRVEIYKNVRREMQEHLRREEERLREEARVAHLSVIAANKERVAVREQARLAKEEEKHKKDLQHAEAEARKMDMLMRLAAQVPYYDDIQNATSKLDHVTAAAQAHLYLGGAEEFRGHMRATGFADTKIISDARFRLAEALRDAAPSLIQSAAARVVIAQFNPRPHLAIHGVLSRTGGVI